MSQSRSPSHCRARAFAIAIAGRRGERALNVVAALGEMRPAVAVNGNDHGVWECGDYPEVARFDEHGRSADECHVQCHRRVT
jgi:hypothetical protein